MTDYPQRTPVGSATAPEHRTGTTRRSRPDERERSNSICPQPSTSSPAPGEPVNTTTRDTRPADPPAGAGNTDSAPEDVAELVARGHWRDVGGAWARLGHQLDIELAQSPASRHAA